MEVDFTLSTPMELYARRQREMSENGRSLDLFLLHRPFLMPMKRVEWQVVDKRINFLAFVLEFELEQDSTRWFHFLKIAETIYGAVLTIDLYDGPYDYWPNQ